MVKQAGKAAQYKLWIEPEVYQERLRLPGNIRQRLKREIEHLAKLPRPSASRTVDVSDLGMPLGIEMRRIRLQSWRIIYAVNDTESWIWVLALRQRPPYDYEDLEDIATKLAR